MSKFVVVGGINVFLTYGLYVFLLATGLIYQLALTVSFTVGVLLGYFANRNWTFSDCRYTSSSFLKYVVTYLLLFVFNFTMLTFLVENKVVDPVLAQLLLVGIVALLSYFIQKAWVFKNKKFN